jgi:rhodanese-related sulfurtransferase
MKNLLYVLLLALVPALILTSCKDNTDDTVTPSQAEFELLQTYMAQNDLDLSNVLDGWVIPGSKLPVATDGDYSIPGWYVIDIRSATDFEAGHIKGAVNVAFADVLDQAPNANGQPILVVCYSGQTAARAVGFLRIMGYEAKSLKWGMSAWHTDFDKWSGKIADLMDPNWITSGDPAPLQVFDYPSFTTGETDGAAILEARVREAMTLDWTISNSDVLGSPHQYFINNKWSLDSWNAYGHIEGAYRIDEDLTLGNLDNLDPVTPMVTYCYTGQTSSITTAWLQVLGFENARSLMFGANAIVHTALVNGSAAAKSWMGEGSASALGYDYVTGPQ